MITNLFKITSFKESLKKTCYILFIVTILLPASVVSFFYLYDFLMGINLPYRPKGSLSLYLNESNCCQSFQWNMHPVDNPGDWLPNGLSMADVNDDGYYDFLTNYEFKGRIRIALNPGPDKLKEKYSYRYWDYIDVAVIPNAESSTFADLDDDGFSEIIIAHGVEHTKNPSGIKIIWGGRILDHKMLSGGFGYSDAVSLPAASDRLHFHYVKAYDIDSDGDLDIVAGGRASRIAGTQGFKSLTYAGLRWFENPGKNCRNVALWNMHIIDKDIESGHGFEFGDIDNDGYFDIVLCNSDWDTPKNSEKIVWYKNPKNINIYNEWEINEIYRGDEFYTKEQIAIYDLNKDNLNDIIVHTEKYIYVFFNCGNKNNNVKFILKKIEKPVIAQWPSRALKIADINNDGSPDIIGALIHKNGKLPKDKAAIFWMENVKGKWLTNVIKWGSGFLGLGKFNGEKWDQIIPIDLDKDGDLDIVANCEEFNRLRSIISVVWFENPLY